MKEIVIDGVRYISADSLGGDIKIVVIERGFVYVGRVEVGDGELMIHSARSLIRWGSSQHLGELVDGPLAETKLGAKCTVRVRDGQVIHTIEVDQNAWHKHING
jgi:hypothetical protein